MSRANSVELQSELLDVVKEHCGDAEIVQHIMSWMDTDTACDCLKDMCRDWDIYVGDILEEEED